MSIEAANGIVDNILHRYELNYHHAPMGKKFQECYNLDTLRPSQEYLDIYENAMHTISLCGMDF
jgi:methylamine--corrinoid protein Co-methyltransferase